MSFIITGVFCYLYHHMQIELVGLFFLRGLRCDLVVGQKALFRGIFLWDSERSF